MAPRIAAYVMLAGAVLLGPGTLIGFCVFVYTGPFNLVNLGFKAPAIYMFDAGLSLLFFAQHSIMVRRFFREWLERTLPAAFYGPVYAIVSGLALLMVMVFWQESTSTVVSFDEPINWVVRSGYFIALAGGTWCFRALGPIDPFGLTPLRDYMRGSTTAPTSFTVRGPYRWVRHPIYFFSILMLWSYPHLTSDRLLLNVLWTVWIVIGTVLEERDLVATFREEYREYQNSVPMLVPWRIPRPGS